MDKRNASDYEITSKFEKHPKSIGTVIALLLSAGFIALIVLFDEIAVLVGCVRNIGCRTPSELSNEEMLSMMIAAIGLVVLALTIYFNEKRKSAERKEEMALRKQESAERERNHREFIAMMTQQAEKSRQFYETNRRESAERFEAMLERMDERNKLERRRQRRRCRGLS